MTNESPDQATHDGSTEPVSKPICPNCERKMPNKAAFCPKCGQRNTNGKVSMRELLVRLWNTTFHLESRFLRMVWHLFIPAKVTLEYFRGRQKRYPHPIQFFLIVMFFWIIVLNALLDGLEKEGKAAMWKHDGTMEEQRGKITLYNEIIHRYDTLSFDLKAKLDATAFDSLMFDFAMKYDKKSSTDSFTYSGLGMPQQKFDSRDVLTMPIDTLLDKYRVTDRYKRWAVSQNLKSYSEGATNMLRFFVKSLSWNILLLTGVMSFVLMLLYRKQQRFFVEHFVLLLHLHTALVFLSTFLMLYLVFDKKYGSYLVWLPILWYLIASLPTMKNYYQQSWKTTTWKWLVFHLLGFGFFLLLMLGGMFLSFLLF